jgi:hypothetical protein
MDKKILLELLKAINNEEVVEEITTLTHRVFDSLLRKGFSREESLVLLQSLSKQK